jgi:hypothetical protein
MFSPKIILIFTVCIISFVHLVSKEQPYFFKYSITSKQISAIQIDGELVWFATQGDGVLVYHKSEDRWTRYTSKDGLPSDKVTALAIDEDFVWIGTWDNGAAKFDKRKKEWITFDVLYPQYWKEGGFRKYMINCITVDGNYIWFGLGGGIGGGARMYDKKNEVWKVAEPFAPNPEYCSKDDLDKYLKFSLIRQKSIKGCFVVKNTEIGDVNAIGIDGEDVWFCETECIAKYNKKSKEWTVYLDEFALYETIPKGEGYEDIYEYANLYGGKPEDFIPRICCLANSIGITKNYIWIDGGIMKESVEYNGLRRYDKRTGKWRRYTSKDGIGSKIVLSIAVDGENVWVGLGGHFGLSFYNAKTNKWTTYNALQSLSCYAVYSLAVDTDSIWIGTDNGIGRLFLKKCTKSPQ